MVIALILISIYAINVTWIAVIQVRRSLKAEKIANVLADNMKSVSDLLQEAQKTLENPKLQQAFAADDEVGIFFKNLVKIQQILDNFIVRDEKEKGE